MKAHLGSFDFILDTVAASHDLDAFTKLIKRDGWMLWRVLVPGNGTSELRYRVKRQG